MSRKSDLPNSKTEARKWVEMIAKVPFVKKIYILGSRSPLKKKKPHKDSDWDFLIESNIKHKLILQSPRATKKLHGDVVVVTSREAKKYDKAVEIWPKDKHNIITPKKKKAKK